jgi:hypothetical protein
MGYISGALPRKSEEAKQLPRFMRASPSRRGAIGLDAFLTFADEVIPHREGELNKSDMKYL